MPAQTCETCRFLETRHIADGVFAPVCGGMAYKPKGSVTGTRAKMVPWQSLSDFELDWRSPNYKRIVTPKLDTCERWRLTREPARQRLLRMRQSRSKHAQQRE